MHTQLDFEIAVKNFIRIPFKYSTLSDEALKKYEKKLKVILPDDYRQFLLLTNGGSSISHFTWVRTISGMWETIGPNTFLGVKADESWAKLPEALTGSNGAWPHGYLGIACDSGGNYLLLNLNKKETCYPFGAIYFLDHERLPEKENMQYVAPSFRSYLAMIEPTDEDADIELENKIQQILETENVLEIDALILNPRWRLDQHCCYGNTLADQALLDGKKRLFQKLVDLGAKVPRFFLYAHIHLSEEEITGYMKSKKL